MGDNSNQQKKVLLLACLISLAVHTSIILILNATNKEGRITGKKLKANSNFTYFQMTDISQSHVNYDL